MPLDPAHDSETEECPQGALAGLRSLPRNVWVVTLTSFLTDVSSEMLASLLPLYLKNVLGAGTTAIGLIEGVAETTASLLKLVSGWLSDKVGNRKWLAVTGYALSLVAKPLLFLVTSWPGVLGYRFAERLGKGVRTAPRDALVAASTPRARRGLAFGVHRAGDTAGAVVGLAVAFAVVWLRLGEGHALDRPVFLTLVGVSLVPAALGVLSLAVGAREVSPPRPAPGTTTPSTQPLGRPFRRFLGITLLFTLGNSSDAFLVLRAQQAGLSLLGVLGMMITFNLVYAAVSVPAGSLSDRVGRRKVIIAGWLVYSLIYLGFAWAWSGGQVWLLMTVYGVYYAATEGVTKAYVADLAPPDRRGTAYGLWNALVGVSALPASLIAGLLWDHFGPSATFSFGAVLALAAAALLALSPANIPNAETGPQAHQAG